MTLNRWLLLLAMVCTSGCATAGAGAGAAAPAAAAPTSATAGATTIVAVQPAAAPASPPCTIWQFLGVPGIAKGACSIVGCIQNRLGTLFPGLEAKPPLLAITDPANAQSSNPAVSAAAGAKADEDAAPQKVKAINYLGTIGCGGCYPEVQDALLAALDDCTEAVRFAAVSALRGTACGQCKVCRKKSCCSPKVMEKLYKVANDVDDTGCYKEPSPRVRRMARLAMGACGGGVPAPTSTPLEGPSEGPPGTAPTPPVPATPAPVVRATPPTKMAARQPAATRQPAAVSQPLPASQRPASLPLPAAELPPTGQPAVARSPVVVAAAPRRPQDAPDQPSAQPEVQQGAVASPSVATPTTPTDCGLPVASPPTVAAPPAEPSSESAQPQSDAEASTPPTEAPSPTVRPAETRRSDPVPPAHSPPAPSGPGVYKVPLPSVAQSAADTSNAPMAIATGIELLQPGADTSPADATAAAQHVAVQVPNSPSPRAPAAQQVVVNGRPAKAFSNQPMPVVVNSVRPTSPAGGPQAGAAGNPALPTMVNASPPTPPTVAERQARSTGPLTIFQTQAAARANVISNPFVGAVSATVANGAAGEHKEIALMSGNQSLPGDPRAAAATTQWANWQVDASRAAPGQAVAAAPMAGISEAQLLAYYRQNVANYCGPAEVRWVWIHLGFNSFAAKPDVYAAAAALRQAAVEGQLAEAMRKYPHTEIRRFTWTPADRLPSKSIAKALLQMQPGEVSVMMQSASGVEVVQLLEARTTTLSFEQVRARVQQDLLDAGRR